MNETLHAEQPMNTTILNYPGFQTLPKGVRQMLLVSEAYFFNLPAAEHSVQRAAAERGDRRENDFMGIQLWPTRMAMSAAA